MLDGGAVGATDNNTNCVDVTSVLDGFQEYIFVLDTPFHRACAGNGNLCASSWTLYCLVLQRGVQELCSILSVLYITPSKPRTGKILFHLPKYRIH